MSAAELTPRKPRNTYTLRPLRGDMYFIPRTPPYLYGVRVRGINTPRAEGENATPEPGSAADYKLHQADQDRNRRPVSMKAEPIEARSPGQIDTRRQDQTRAADARQQLTEDQHTPPAVRSTDRADQAPTRPGTSCKRRSRPSLRYLQTITSQADQDRARHQAGHTFEELTAQADATADIHSAEPIDQAAAVQKDDARTTGPGAPVKAAETQQRNHSKTRFELTGSQTRARRIDAIAPDARKRPQKLEHELGHNEPTEIDGRHTRRPGCQSWHHSGNRRPNGGRGSCQHFPGEALRTRCRAFFASHFFEACRAREDTVTAAAARPEPDRDGRTQAGTAGDSHAETAGTAIGDRNI